MYSFTETFHFVFQLNVARKKPAVPPKPLGPIKTLELNAKSRQLNQSLKEMQQQSLANSRSSLAVSFTFSFGI
jgi:hypothetical protein